MLAPEQTVLSSKNQARAGLTAAAARRIGRSESLTFPSAHRPIKKYSGGDLKIHQESVGMSCFPSLVHFPDSQARTQRVRRESVSPGETCFFYSPSLIPPGMDLPRQDRSAALGNTEGPCGFP